MVSGRTMIGISFVQADPKMPIMVLPDTIWSFQAPNIVLYLWQSEAPKRCLEILFFLKCVSSQEQSPNSRSDKFSLKVLSVMMYWPICYALYAQGLWSVAIYFKGYLLFFCAFLLSWPPLAVAWPWNWRMIPKGRGGSFFTSLGTDFLHAHLVSRGPCCHVTGSCDRSCDHGKGVRLLRGHQRRTFSAAMVLLISYLSFARKTCQITSSPL